MSRQSRQNPRKRHYDQMDKHYDSRYAQELESWREPPTDRHSNHQHWRQQQQQHQRHDGENERRTIEKNQRVFEGTWERDGERQTSFTGEAEGERHSGNQQRRDGENERQRCTERRRSLARHREESYLHERSYSPTTHDGLRKGHRLGHASGWEGHVWEEQVGEELQSHGTHHTERYYSEEQPHRSAAGGAETHRQRPGRYADQSRYGGDQRNRYEERPSPEGRYRECDRGLESYHRSAPVDRETGRAGDHRDRQNVDKESLPPERRHRESGGGVQPCQHSTRLDRETRGQRLHTPDDDSDRYTQEGKTRTGDNHPSRYTQEGKTRTGDSHPNKYTQEGKTYTGDSHPNKYTQEGKTHTGDSHPNKYTQEGRTHTRNTRRTDRQPYHRSLDIDSAMDTEKHDKHWDSHWDGRTHWDRDAHWDGRTHWDRDAHWDGRTQWDRDTHWDGRTHWDSAHSDERRNLDGRHGESLHSQELYHLSADVEREALGQQQHKHGVRGEGRAQNHNRRQTIERYRHSEDPRGHHEDTTDSRRTVEQQSERLSNKDSKRGERTDSDHIQNPRQGKGHEHFAENDSQPHIQKHQQRSKGHEHFAGNDSQPLGQEHQQQGWVGDNLGQISEQEVHHGYRRRDGECHRYAAGENREEQVDGDGYRHHDGECYRYAAGDDREIEERHRRLSEKGWQGESEERERMEDPANSHRNSRSSGPPISDSKHRRGWRNLDSSSQGRWFESHCSAESSQSHQPRNTTPTLGDIDTTHDLHYSAVNSNQHDQNYTVAAQDDTVMTPVPAYVASTSQTDWNQTSNPSLPCSDRYTSAQYPPFTYSEADPREAQQGPDYPGAFSSEGVSPARRLQRERPVPPLLPDDIQYTSLLHSRSKCLLLFDDSTGEFDIGDNLDDGSCETTRFSYIEPDSLLDIVPELVVDGQKKSMKNELKALRKQYNNIRLGRPFHSLMPEEKASLKELEHKIVPLKKQQKQIQKKHKAESMQLKKKVDSIVQKMSATLASPIAAAGAAPQSCYAKQGWLTLEIQSIEEDMKELKSQLGPTPSKTYAMRLLTKLRNRFIQRRAEVCNVLNRKKRQDGHKPNPFPHLHRLGLKLCMWHAIKNQESHRSKKMTKRAKKKEMKRLKKNKPKRRGKSWEPKPQEDGVVLDSSDSCGEEEKEVEEKWSSVNWLRLQKKEKKQVRSQKTANGIQQCLQKRNMSDWEVTHSHVILTGLTALLLFRQQGRRHFKGQEHWSRVYREGQHNLKGQGDEGQGHLEGEGTLQPLSSNWLKCSQFVADVAKEMSLLPCQQDTERERKRTIARENWQRQYQQQKQLANNLLKAAYQHGINPLTGKGPINAK